MYCFSTSVSCCVSDSDLSYCNSTWDTVSCWPTTLAGHLAVLSCPLSYDGVAIDASGTYRQPSACWVKIDMQVDLYNVF